MIIRRQKIEINNDRPSSLPCVLKGGEGGMRERNILSKNTTI
jgi:hypothetical protein